MPRRTTRSTGLWATLPLYLIRLILVSCLVLVVVTTCYMDAFDIQDGWILPAFFAIIFVHHMASLIKWKFFVGMFEILLLMFEISGCIILSIIAKPKAWFPESSITFEVMSVIITGSLVIVATTRLFAVVSSRCRSLWTPVNVFSDHPAMIKANLLNKIFGRSLWKVHFAGETRIMRFIRGVIGLVFFTMISCFIMLNVIFKPTQETALSPVKEYHASVLPAGIATGIELPTWNIVFVLPPFIENHTAIMPIQPEVFFSVANVTASWPFLNSTVFKPSCTNTSKLVTHHRQHYATYIFRCGTAQQLSGWTLPDLVVSVDFTQIIPTLQHLLGLPPQMNLPIILGMTNDTERLLQEQVVMRSLIPGMNIMSSVTAAVRETFKHPALAAFGIFQESDAFFFPRVVDTYPDLSSLVSRGENISTLRLWSPADIGFRKTTVIQDYRENSVLAGLASVGGLWTALGGIFVLIFGASILRIIYGLKPLSLLGLAHSFQNEHLKKEWLNQYPKIASEHQTQADRGLLALLRDHVIDVKFLDLEAPDDEKAAAEELVFQEAQTDIENPEVTVDESKRRSTESLIQLLPLGVRDTVNPLLEGSAEQRNCTTRR